MRAANVAKSRHRAGPPQEECRGDWTAPRLCRTRSAFTASIRSSAALDNKERQIIKLSLTQNALVRLEIGPVEELGFPVEIVSPQDLDKILGPDAIHQGVMLETRPLPVRRLSALNDSPLILVLDEITDPHNVGAIMRSAVAFNAGALITTMRHSPTELGVLAKSASGALEMIPYIQITNLADALDELHKLGFTSIGLDLGRPCPLGNHTFRTQDRACTRRRGQGPAPEDPLDRDDACPAGHARRHQVAERLECGGHCHVRRAGSSRQRLKQSVREGRLKEA